ncbi:hypothetical protein CPB85DRAFT_1289418, partial [Mucidula mucida]
MHVLMSVASVNTYLYGIVCNQFAIYFFSENFGRKDSWWIRTTVVVLFINDTVHSAAQIYMAWFYCIDNYDNPDILTIAPWPYPLTPISGALAAILIHNFMAVRIFRLTNNWFIYVGVMITAVGVFGCGMAVGVKAWIIHEVLQVIVLKPFIIAWLVGQTMIDLFLTCTLTLVLYRSRTGFHNTDTVINRLVRGAIQTGLFASVFAIALLITYLGSPNTNLYGMFAMPIGRIYTTALMDTLISREDLKEMLSGTIEVQFHFSRANVS